MWAKNKNDENLVISIIWGLPTIQSLQAEAWDELNNLTLHYDSSSPLWG